MALNSGFKGLISRRLWFAVCFGKLSLSDISIRNNQAASDRASAVAKVLSKWRGRRKRTKFQPCWRVKCGMSLHPAGNIQLEVPHRPIDLQRHPTLHTPAWLKFSPFLATASFRKDFGHRVRPISHRLIISYGDIWKGEFTKQTANHWRFESKHHRKHSGSDSGRTGKDFPKYGAPGSILSGHFQHMLWCRHISHTTIVFLFKFRCNIFIGVGIIKQIPGSVASGTPCRSLNLTTIEIDSY